MGRRRMEWLARANHLGGLPRILVIRAVGTFAKVVANLLNTNTVHNGATLIQLVRSRPPGVQLLTVSNHISTCYLNFIISYWKCIPITRGAGIYQEHMMKLLILHTFPEGKVCQEDAPVRRLKCGTASVIARAPVTPIVLPIIHRGFEKVMPENYAFGRRPPVPLWNQEIKIVVGEPMEFNLPELREMILYQSRDSSSSSGRWPRTILGGLGEAAQRCLYMTISDQIRTTLENLRSFSKVNLM
ncbi:unnamed protein product [Withania somnifera]